MRGTALFRPHRQSGKLNLPQQVRRKPADVDEVYAETIRLEKAVASFFTPVSKKEPDQITWRIVNSTLLLAKYNPDVTSHATEPLTKRRKIAAFDLVGPLT